MLMARGNAVMLQLRDTTIGKSLCLLLSCLLALVLVKWEDERKDKESPEESGEECGGRKSEMFKRSSCHQVIANFQQHPLLSSLSSPGLFRQHS